MTVTRYGSDIDLSSKKRIKSQDIKKNYGLAYPVDKRKHFFSKEAGHALLKSNLHQLLLTEPGERVMMPDYGCNLKRFLFQPMDEMTFQGIQQAILGSINKYMPEVSVTRLKVSKTEKLNYEGVQGIYISLYLKPKDIDLSTFEVNFNVT